VYDEEETAELDFKDFMVKHVTSYEPAVFLGLAKEWSALEKWNLSSDHVNTAEEGGEVASGWDYLNGAFGEDFLLEVITYMTNTWCEYFKYNRRDYETLSEFKEKSEKRKQRSKVYKTRNGNTGTQQKEVLVEQEVPLSLRDDIVEPTVTS